MMVDIVEVASRYTHLRRSGREWVGRCPLHDDRTPSFYVNPEKGVYYCFGCGAGGDAVELVARAEGVPREEARRMLGLGGRDEPVGLGRRVMEAARAAYPGSKAQEYARSRGIGDETAERYALGYGALPPSLEEEALTSGLYLKGMRGRLLLPIRDTGGRVVGFTARYIGTPPKGVPKYLHSRGTKHPYGLYEALEGIRRYGYVVVVEGVMDVLALAPLGVPAVAPLGARLTPQVLATIRRHAPSVILALDRDRAGIEGAVAALRELRPLVGVSVVVWPKKDPGEMTPEEVEKALARPMPPSEFLYRWARWRYPRLEDRLRALKPWLTPASLEETVAHELRALLRADGVELEGKVQVRPRPHPEETVASLEGDILAVLLGVDGEHREALIREVELGLPEPGLLSHFLQALRAPDPLAALQAAGSGEVLYRQLVRAPRMTPEDARRRLAVLLRELRVAYWSRLMAEAAQRAAQGDRAALKEVEEYAAAIEAERRS